MLTVILALVGGLVVFALGLAANAIATSNPPELPNMHQTDNIESIIPGLYAFGEERALVARG
jgi:hypothetical protein